MPVLMAPKQRTKPETIEPVEIEGPSFGESTQPRLGSAQNRKRRLAGDDVADPDADIVTIEDEKDKEILSLRSGKKMAKPRIELDDDTFHSSLNRDVTKANKVLNTRIEKEAIFGNISYLNNSGLPRNIEIIELDKILTSDDGGAVRNNKRKLSWEEKVTVETIEIEDVVEDEVLLDINTAPCTSPVLDILVPHISRIVQMDSDSHDVNSSGALSRKDKGKDKVIEYGLPSNVADPLDLRLSLGVGNTNVEEEFSSFINIVKEENDVVIDNSPPVLEDERNHMADARGRVKERFRDIARKNASRFAHFSSQEREENHVDNQPVIEMTRVEDERKGEDQPGPFSTAMKIIRDRASNVSVTQKSCGTGKSKTGSINWEPRTEKLLHQCAPKLQDLCMDILAKNADAISSLESVPDVIRHKLSHILCDSRKMNAQFLDLLVCGSPTEIRIRDCSWLTEEEFTRAFETCEGSHLSVLQLDQCGRCLPDYLLPNTLARSLNAFPVLTALSIKGACRLTDTGLSAIVASAPALRSINLSQCSLLTCEGINTLATSLGSILRELYLDDCEAIEPMLILPALLKLEQLQVLSMAGIETVSDLFVKELVAVRGQYFKELVLTDCMKLTDLSLKAIAENCSGLHALDLSNLHRLTDSSLGYLANGCRTVEKLKLSRNAFSDETIAAFLEASGESLTDLSLNNIRKVGDDTAISIANRSRNLLTLDLSWCRNLSNEALGLIVDSCLSLKILKIFGCTQITDVFVNGHSNSQLKIIGLKLTPILKNLRISEPQQGPLHYPAVFS